MLERGLRENWAERGQCFRQMPGHAGLFDYEDVIQEGNGGTKAGERYGQILLLKGSLRAQSDKWFGEVI